MKVLILAGGKGNRFNDLLKGKNKCMFLLNGKPIIEYSLDFAADLNNIKEIIIVVGYKAEEIINRYGNSYKNKKIKYVIQKKQKGLVDAIGCAKEALEQDNFMLMLADEFLVNPKHKKFIETFEKHKIFGLCGIVKGNNKNRIRKTYAVLKNDKDRIILLIEKPLHIYERFLMGTGNCIFNNDILSYICLTPVGSSNEKELADLIQVAIDKGAVVYPFEICDEYININSQVELKEANCYFDISAGREGI